ncbi:MAG: SGNH/GDSL hydrolase family protein [Acidimicrobiales bacterium]
MPVTVPSLEPIPPGPGLRLLARMVPAVGVVVEQIAPYTAWWDEQNQEASVADGPLLVAVGDSTAIGVGASHPALSYVGRLRHLLERHHGAPWRVINLARSGARLDDGLDRQVPILDQVRWAGGEPDVVVACLGTNDLVWGKEVTMLRERVRSLVDRLPPATVVGMVAGGSARAQLVNRAIRGRAGELGRTVVDPWAEPTPPGQRRLAGDRFHPNDLGYELMAIPFARALGLDPPSPEHLGTVDDDR